jgi:cathepsin F
MKLISLVLILAGLVFIQALKVRPHPDEKLFHEWNVQYGKEINLDYDKRLQNFKASIQRIREKNERSAGKGATYALNKFSDLSPEEFKQRYLLKNFTKTPKAIKNQNLIPIPRTLTAPQEWDWRTKNVITPVKDQAQCGSCWAFSATENIESVWMLAKNLTTDKFQPLAPQQIVDCDKSDLGCNGGNPPTAYEYVQSAGGMEIEKDYPYVASDETCKFDKTKAKVHISGYKYSSGVEATMLTEVSTWSPLSVCVDAEYWQDYSSGVMGEWECCWVCELDHCVQAVGYKVDTDSPYWILRNSWGTDWGMSGYILVDYGHNTCALTQEATTATV